MPRNDELTRLREDNERLQAELAKLMNEQLEFDEYLYYNREVYATRFAATAWTEGDNPGIRLFIVQNNAITELIYNGVYPEKLSKARWERGFTFPGAVLPNSPIVAGNSLVSKSTVNKDEDRVIRLFFFNTDGHLRQWKWNGEWKLANFSLENMDTRNLSLTFWAKSGRAWWSLLYLEKYTTDSKGIQKQGRLIERRLMGEIGEVWGDPVVVEWPNKNPEDNLWNSELGSNPLNSAFSEVSDEDGTNRFIIYPAIKGSSDVEFRALKWDRSKWVPHPWPGRVQAGYDWNGEGRSFSAFHVPEPLGIRLYHPGEERLVEWMNSKAFSGGHWKETKMGKSCSATDSLVATAVQHHDRGSRHYYMFSSHEGKVVLTTLKGGVAPYSQPVILGDL